MRRVFITGAAGFVGSCVAAVAASHGAQVLALMQPDSPADRLNALGDKITRLEGDLAQPATYAAALERFAPDLCFHLAWYAEPGKYLTSPRNIDSLLHSLTLLQALTRVGCGQIVAAGTCAEYDTRFGWLREDTPCNPQTIYASTKLGLSMAGKQFLQDTGGRFAWARLFFLYGPREDPRRLIPAAIKALRDGQPFLASSGVQIRDYLHVTDVAEALWALGISAGHGDFNIASGKPVSIADILTEVGALMERPDLIRLGELPQREWDPMFICGDRSKLTALTGWAPRIALRDGLRDLVERSG